MGVTTKHNIAWELKPVLYSYLKKEFNLCLRSIEQCHSETRFAEYIRGLVERKSTELLPAMGGAKYFVFMIDRFKLNDDPNWMREQVERMLVELKASYWTGFLMDTWGYKRSDETIWTRDQMAEG